MRNVRKKRLTNVRVKRTLSLSSIVNLPGGVHLDRQGSKMPNSNSIKKFFDLLRADMEPSARDLRALNVIELELISNAIQAHLNLIGKFAVSKGPNHVH